LTVRTVRLPDRRVWLRLADPHWIDLLDPTHAREHGGRWNPPGSHPTLYLSGDVGTARMQVERMLEGSPVHLDDLHEVAYVLIAATLPRAQHCADAVTAEGLSSLGLPETYPQGSEGERVGHETCRAIGRRLRAMLLRGVWCRSACTADGEGRELAWFPATGRSRATPVWDAPLPIGRWRYATTWAELGLDDQPEPVGIAPRSSR